MKNLYVIDYILETYQWILMPKLTLKTIEGCFIFWTQWINSWKVKVKTDEDLIIKLINIRTPVHRGPVPAG